ncbi:Prolyl oligopeptidase family protein [compost metagenome]
MLGQHFWNYGNVLGSTVDDIGFLEALVDTISAHYSINPNRVYSTGASNGGFMCYALACQSNRFAAIAAVTGSMSVNMYNACNPSYPIPTMHIHGTSDQINPYTGNSTMKGIEEVTAFWVDQNNCNPTPVMTPVANSNVTDNATAERYLYAGGTEGHTVELFKITGGGHTWPGAFVSTSNGNTCMDFSACNEIWRFFSQHERGATVSLDNEVSENSINIWPNPSQGIISIQSENAVVTTLTLFDLQGRLIEKHSGENIQTLDLSHFNSGNYLLQISGKQFNTFKRIQISASN